MAQRKQLTWAELRVGIFVLAGLFIVMVAVFYVTGGTGLFGSRYRLYTELPEVEGMKTGAPVNLDGIEIGNVQSISLNSNARDRLHSVRLVLRIDKKYQSQIRTDSTASLVTQGLLGDRYVTIKRGITGSVIPNKGEIPGVEEKAIQQVVEQIQNGSGTLGKFMNDPSFYNNLNETAAKFNAMATSIQQGQGSAGKLIASDELYNKVDATMDDVHDVTSALREQKGSLGKLIYDPSAYDEIKNVAQKGDALLSDVRQGKGTLGKLATDETLYANVREASADLRDATAKLNSNQGTLGRFFSDPQLYDNLTGLTGDMRLLVNDFRKNPKKFLHIKLGVF